jgi:hypothetical protein
VFLVPIASSIILASIISIVFQIFNKPLSKIVIPLQTAILAIIIMLGYLGVDHTITLLNTPEVGVTAFSRFIGSTFRFGNLYLIPPDMESFRLAAKVPIFVDYKSHPYKDTEVIEWFNRVVIAKDFYASSGDTACSILQSMSEKYGITHVISKYSVSNCGMLNESYRDAHLVIYEVQSR